MPILLEIAQDPQQFQSSGEEVHVSFTHGPSVSFDRFPESWRSEHLAHGDLS